MKRWLSHPVLQVAAVLAVLSLSTLVTTLPLGRVTEVAIYVLYAAGIILLVGYLGLVPFGGSVFFGLAGYAAAISMLRWFQGADEFAGMAFALGFALLAAVPVGALILRRRGLYFSLLTLACTQICFEVAYKWTDFTGGENGLQRVPRPVLDSPLAYHLFVCAVVLVAIALLWRLAHSPLGRLFQAIRDNEQRAASLGYATYPVKLAAFVISAGVTGLAGALLTFFMRGVYANPLGWEHASDAVLMAVLGGIHHLLGAVWGAVLFIVLEDQLGGLLDHWWLVFAPILMLVVLVAPEGLHGLFRRLRRAPGWTLVRPGIPRQPAAIEPFRPLMEATAGDAPLLTVRGLRKNFGSLVIAAGYDFDVHAACLHSFIGPNGAGKTTFFNMLSGIVRPDGGEVRFLGRDITRMPMHKRIRLGLARSFQIVSVFQNLSAFENVRLAVQAGRPRAYAPWGDAHRDVAVNARTWSILEAVGLVPKAAELCTALSHGERRLLEIGITLATEGRLLLLDEPLAGLAEADRVRVSALIRSLSRTHAVVLIEHDIDRVLALSDRITVLHQGRLIADGKPAEVAANPEVVRAYLGTPPQASREPAAATADADRARGEVLLSAHGLAGGYGGGRVLDGAAIEVRAGEAVALLGRNGVGKTTLLKALYGMLPLQEGTILWCGQDIRRLAPYQVNRLGIAMVPEGRRLFPNLTVLENLRIATRPGGMPLQEVFELFPRLAVLRHSRAENLSGGERQMVAIARALVAPAKLILLDEPFEGLAPAVVNEVMGVLLKLRRRVAMVLVEHHAEQVLAIVDRAVVLVNGRVAWSGDAHVLAADAALQARLLGLVEASPSPALSQPSNHSETEHA